MGSRHWKNLFGGRQSNKVDCRHLFEWGERAARRPAAGGPREVTSVHKPRHGGGRPPRVSRAELASILATLWPTVDNVVSGDGIMVVGAGSE